MSFKHIPVSLEAISHHRDVHRRTDGIFEIGQEDVLELCLLVAGEPVYVKLKGLKAKTLVKLLVSKSPEAG